MPVFRLMRRASETPDHVSDAIAAAVREHERTTELRRAHTKVEKLKVLFPDSRFREPSDHLVRTNGFFMEFWNMKARGELTSDETAAVWAVMMRKVDVGVAVRILFEHCYSGPPDDTARMTVSERCLCEVTLSYKTISAAPHTQPFISKWRTKLVDALHHVTGRTTAPRVLDPQDAQLFLQACEAVVEVKREDDKRWRDTEKR